VGVGRGSAGGVSPGLSWCTGGGRGGVGRGGTHIPCYPDPQEGGGRCKQGGEVALENDRSPRELAGDWRELTGDWRELAGDWSELAGDWRELAGDNICT
jgi:hypothetical protein